MSNRLMYCCLGAVLPIMLVSCSSETTSSEPTETSAQSDSAAVSTDTDEKGQLEIRANGEDFVRQGFVTKDGWQIDFDHLYVTLSQITAYQSTTPYEAEAGKEPEADIQVTISEPITVDLAVGDETAEPVLVKAVDAPAGRYNALSWEMTPATAGAAEGYPLFLQGQATKADETVDFTMKLDTQLRFVCGDYVGDVRKGIVQENSTTDLEATFHFDHLFGDGEAPADDDINTGALGFDPLAAIAEDGSLDVDTAALESQLSPEAYRQLLAILPSLGHVGEGHCAETVLVGGS